MRKSKFLFYIIAAIVIALVLILLFFNPLSPDGPAGPTEQGTHPSNTDPALSGTLATEPPGTSYPVMTGPSVDPAPSEPTFPRETFVPDESHPVDLPPSNGSEYSNIGGLSIQLNVDEYPEPREFLVEFGVDTEGMSNYLYLNPKVKPCGSDADKSWYKYFQFTFTPSAGRVVTITDAEPGNYSGDGCVTFIRAFDYALPCQYINEEQPGTIWYMPEGESLGQNQFAYIDVRVFGNGILLATLQLDIFYSSDRGYCIAGISNRNQLDPRMPGNRHQLSQTHLDNLMALATEAAYGDEYQCMMGNNDPAKLSAADFIIEWREQGKGTYFDYTSSLTGRADVIASTDLDDTPLVAVTLRTNHWDVMFAPVTLYYRIAEGGGENGETLYELVGIDHHKHYWCYYLYYDGVPGYSLPEENN